MAKVDETLPCPQCGHPTYSNTDEPGVINCSESEKPVLVCDATPIWREEALASAVSEENERRDKAGDEDTLDTKKELEAKASASA